jgi:hypothetical protein
VIEPEVWGMSIEPDGETTGIDESGDILVPVRGAEVGFRFLDLHKIRILGLPHP